MSSWQISGGEAWAEKDLLTVEAKPSESVQSILTNLRYSLFDIEDQHLREMLQALLVDRFQLKSHRETKIGVIHLLKRNGKTLRLQPTQIPSTAEAAATDHSFGSIGYASGKWGIFATSMPQLAKFAADFILHSPVMDETSLRGSFEYRQTIPDAEPN